MRAAPHPREIERLRALMACNVLDTGPDPAFDELTSLAAQLCGTPIALVSLVDEARQWFKSKVGLDANETHRDLAFCAHAILHDEPLIVADATKDARFSDNPLVTGELGIRFYAGIPLVLTDGMPLGTLCIIDLNPREIEDEELETLRALARQVAGQLELRRKMSELESTKGALEMKNRELEQFVYTASHDLKSPIVTILGFIGHLKRDITSGKTDRVLSFVDRVEKAVYRMRDNIDDLLELSRAGRAACDPERVDLGAVVGDLLVEYDQRITREGVEVQVTDELPVVLADSGRMIQVFDNLISNSLKYGAVAEQPRLEIGALTVNGEHRIYVRDNGDGIESKYHEKVFGLFERLRNDGDGTGIGLAIVKRIVEVHNGRVWLESEPGDGATFWVAFPMVVQASVAA